MRAAAIISITTIIIPTYFAIEIFNGGIYTAWILVTFYAMVLGMVYMARFFQGKWKKMKVIEDLDHINQ
jgi:Na+-driven multidrug efflux pump